MALTKVCTILPATRAAAGESRTYYYPLALKMEYTKTNLYIFPHSKFLLGTH